MPDQRDQRRKRLETFRVIVSERVTALNVAWIQLEQQVGNAEAAANLSGTLHTLKGEAGLLGFRAIAEIAHALEDLVERVLAAGEPPGPELGQAVLEALDLVEALAAHAPEDESPAVAPMLTRLVGHEPPPPGARLASPAPEPQTEEPRSQGAESPGTAGGARSDTAGAVGPRGDAEPRSRSTYAVRVRPEQLDRMRDIIAELLLARTRLALGAAALHEQRYGIRSGDISAELGAGIGGDDLAPHEARERTRDEVLRSIESQLRDNVVRMSTLITALDEVSRELRMVSISMIFDRYPVAVRKISRELGRQVDLRCYGDADEADRDVLEALDAPLLHLVRNALDHGIEPPEVRRAAGKPPAGTLTLRARIASDMLHVEVTDDGAGVDIEGVRRMAVERGVLDQATARGLSDTQMLQCLFLPGMSTRAEVTAISGRGVGLDVVQKTVRNLGGAVEIHSERGAGTTFHITVPIRAAITAVLLFRVGRRWYALPNSALVGLAEIGELPTAQRIDGPVVHYEGELVPVIALEPVLGEAAPDPGSARRGSGRIIIARDGERLVAFTGSHSHSQREAILASVSPLMREDTLVSAGMGLEDGSVALVLNVAEVVKAARGEAGVRVSTAPTRAGGAPAPLVLVAEDSPIVRDLIVESLRAHGLRVLEAADGREALHRLTQHPEVALLVTDLEMPHLDGLGLIATLRARGGRRIPAIVVSTRGSDEDKLAAVEVGADAYLIKSDFSQQGLWSIVSRFLG